jgi:hypothetical protein
MNAIQVFTYNSNQVRMLNKNGEPWWVLADVCNVLGLSTPARVAERLDDDEVSQTHIIDALGRKQKASIINESGLYSVILRSDKKEAKSFRKWVTSEVLPSIRRTGTYSIHQQEDTDSVDLLIQYDCPDVWKRKIYTRIRTICAIRPDLKFNVAMILIYNAMRINRGVDFDEELRAYYQQNGHAPESTIEMVCNSAHLRAVFESVVEFAENKLLIPKPAEEKPEVLTEEVVAEEPKMVQKPKALQHLKPTKDSTSTDTHKMYDLRLVIAPLAEMMGDHTKGYGNTFRYIYKRMNIPWLSHQNWFRKENQLRTQPSKFTVAQNDYRTNRKFVDTVKKVINEIGVEET